MPKRISTFARCDDGIRNPFTRRCVKLRTETGRHLAQMAHHPAEFNRKMKAAGVPKPDRQLVLDQWRYIARITDDRPPNIPTPAPDERPPRLSKSAVDAPLAGAPAKKPKAVVRAHVSTPQKRSGVSYKKDWRECETSLGTCRSKLRKTEQDLHKYTIRGKEASVARRATLSDLKAKHTRRLKKANIGTPVAKESVKELRLKLLRKKKRARIDDIIKKIDAGPAAAAPSKRRKLTYETKKKKDVVEEEEGLAAQEGRVSSAKLSKAEKSAKEKAFTNEISARKNEYYGITGLKGLTPEIRKRAVERIEEIVRFMRDRNNWVMTGSGKARSTKVAPKFSTKMADLEAYSKTANTVLNATAIIREGMKRSGVSLTDKELADAADVLTRNTVLILLIQTMDPAMDETISEEETEKKKKEKKEEEEKEEKKKEKEETEKPKKKGSVEFEYDDAADIDINDVSDPITFLIGSGASEGAGIDIFADDMSTKSSSKLGEMIEQAWEKVPKHSDADQKKYAAALDWGGSMKDYFMSEDAPGRQLRHCLTKVAARHYQPVMLAAWEFVFTSLSGKRPGMFHKIIKSLEPLKSDDGSDVLANTITVNVDSLEFAADISELGIIPANGSIMLKQTAGTAFGEERMTLVNSVDEIRSGKYRPGFALYGDDMLPDIDDMQNVLKDAGQEGTLIILGASLATSGSLLKGMSVKTAIVVNSDNTVAGDTVAALKDSSDASKEDADEDSEIIERFSSQNVYMLKSSRDLLALLNRVYDGIVVPQHTNTNNDPKVTSVILQRINEFVGQ